MRALVVALALTTLSIDSALAQESQRGSDEEIEEIIVTATRRATALQDTALSVTALSDAELQAMGARDLIDYFEHVPGLTYTEDTFTGYRIASRGVAAGTFIETRPLSAFYLDETPMISIASGSATSPQFGGARPQTVDVARVEVLRGPQGTLFGASTMGGVVRMITNAPDTEQLYGNAEMGYSTTEHGGSNYLVNGTLNAPLIDDRLAIRLVGYWRDDSGYIDNIERGIKRINDIETSGGRVALLWNATPRLAITARAHFQERESDGMNAADVAAGDYKQIRYTPERDDEKWNLLTLEADYELPWANLKLITSHLDREPSLALDITEFVGGIFPFNPTKNDIQDDVDDTIHELRLTSNSYGKLLWVAGVYYQKQERSWTQEWQSPGFDDLNDGLAEMFGYPDVPLHLRVSGDLRQRAIYGEVSYQLNPAWEATVGARFFEFDYDIDNFQDGLVNGGPSSIRASSDENGVTPKFGLAYRPGDHSLLFANAAQGFRPGGTNEFTETNAENCEDTLKSLGLPAPPARGFESDSLWNFELGMKLSWPDLQLDVNATVYHVRWDDMQTTRTVDCGIDLINIIENVGKATTDGFEFELMWSPTDAVAFRLGTAYTDASLAEDAPNILGEDGEHIPTVPKWEVNASITADFPLTARVDGFARASYNYVDSSWSDFDESIRRRTPSRQVVDLR